MPDPSRILDSPWRWLWAGLLVLAGLVWLLVDRLPHAGRGREVGGVEELRALAQSRDTHVLFVLIDTLRADFVGAYGYERPTTPTLDGLAKRGVRFAHNQSQSSWTKASMASLWSGLYPAGVGVTDSQHAIPEEAVLPAEILKDAGFRTVGLWTNGWLDPSFGFGQGFDEYRRVWGDPESEGESPSGAAPRETGSDEEVFEAAEAFIRKSAGERWFLYLHLMGVHGYAIDNEASQFGVSFDVTYGDAVREVDALLGGFLVFLEEQGLLEKTLVVVASDHGEAFRERGFVGHAREVYRETTEVPWVVGLPFDLEPGVVVESRARNVDIWPTVLDLLGLPPMKGTDGRSQRASVLAAVAGSQGSEDALEGISHLDRSWGQEERPPQHMVSVVEGPYRFVLSQDTSMAGGAKTELFDRRNDPQERKNVKQEHPEVASHLRERAVDYLENTSVPWSEGNPNVELSEEQLELLRALGYQVP